MLAFVNLGKITDAEIVYMLLTDKDIPSIFIYVREKGREGYVHLNVARLSDRPERETSILESERSECQVLVEDFSRNAGTARRKHELTISELVAKGRLVAEPRYRDGKLKQHFYLAPTGIEACTGYGLALLYDKDREYGKRLRQCAYEPCERWFLSYAEGGGPRPKYCCEQHQEQADKDRAPNRALASRARAKKVKKEKS